MSKTLVNIISEESPIPAYLFIKEKYTLGDRLMFISAKDAEDDLDHLSSLFNVPSNQIDEVVLARDSDEFMYERICRRLRKELKADEYYYVNLAGGTRYLALAVQQAFAKLHADFFYVNMEGNTLVKSIYDDSIYDDDDYTYPIIHKMSVAEYLKVHGMQHDIENSKHKPIVDYQCTLNFFKLFSKQLVPSYAYEVIEQLRYGYRNAKSKDSGRILFNIKRKTKIKISEMESPRNYEWVEIPNLSSFLYEMHFVPKEAGYLSKDEIDFLTGGWLEDFVYYIVKKHVKPDDVQKGVHIFRRDIPRHDNELDVVFTKNNHLYVMECKTGVENNRLFNEIVYKVCALREALLGMFCKSYIVSLKKDNDENGLKKIAQYMGVTFCDNYTLTHPGKLEALLESLK